MCQFGITGDKSINPDTKLRPYCLFFDIFSYRIMERHKTSSLELETIVTRLTALDPLKCK